MHSKRRVLSTCIPKWKKEEKKKGEITNHSLRARIRIHRSNSTQSLQPFYFRLCTKNWVKKRLPGCKNLLRIEITFTRFQESGKLTFVADSVCWLIYCLAWNITSTLSLCSSSRISYYDNINSYCYLCTYMIGLTLSFAPKNQNKEKWNPEILSLQQMNCGLHRWNPVETQGKGSWKGCFDFKLFATRSTIQSCAKEECFVQFESAKKRLSVGSSNVSLNFQLECSVFSFAFCQETSGHSWYPLSSISVWLCF